MEDDPIQRSIDRANEIEARLRDQSKKEARYEHRLLAMGLSFFVVFAVISLPTQNDALSLVAGTIAALLVNLFLKQAHRIDDN